MNVDVLVELRKGDEKRAEGGAGYQEEGGGETEGGSMTTPGNSAWWVARPRYTDWWAVGVA